MVVLLIFQMTAQPVFWSIGRTLTVIIMPAGNIFGKAQRLNKKRLHNPPNFGCLFNTIT
jgi:hypothetical protein